MGNERSIDERADDPEALHLRAETLHLSEEALRLAEEVPRPSEEALRSDKDALRSGEEVPLLSEETLRPLILRIERLDDTLPLPAYAYPGDAGLDLRAARDCVIAPLERTMIPTGLKVAIPAGYVGFVQPRSGLAARVGLSMANTPGLIDSQYRGEVTIIAINLDPETGISIKRGDRIAQLVILPVPLVQIEEVTALDETERNNRGFGSSGL
jgi:dUTP pyrophosphatase